MFLLLAASTVFGSLIPSLPKANVLSALTTKTSENALYSPANKNYTKDPQFDPENTYTHPEPQGLEFSMDEMLKRVNEERSKVGSQPLAINQALINAAQSHSQDQANINQMTHTGSDGSNVGQRVQKEGFNWRFVAENVAYNQRSVQQVMQSWINSNGHYQNIINPKAKFFGAGMKDYYWTQDFCA